MSQFGAACIGISETVRGRKMVCVQLFSPFCCYISADEKLPPALLHFEKFGKTEMHFQKTLVTF